MKESGPDYESYTLPELLDALDCVDREQYPDRVSAIEREIEKRQQNAISTTPTEADSGEAEVVVAQGSPGINPDQRRWAAFFTDLVIVGVTWVALINSVVWPWPRTLTSFGFGVLFLVYFLVSDVVAGTSIGKRQFRVVICSASGGAPSRWVMALRVVIVASIVAVKWELIFATYTAISVPMVLVLCVWAFRLTVLWLNIFLAAAVPGGRMIQDRLTGTHVKSAGSSLESQSSAKGSIGRWRFTPLLAFILAAGIACVWALGTTYAIGRLVGLPAESILLQQSRERYEINRRIERQVAADTGIRTEVEVQSQRTWSTSEGTTRILRIEVWMPLIAWGHDNRAQVVQSAVRALKVTPGIYDRGVAAIWTGMLFAKTSLEYSLNLPPVVPRDSGHDAAQPEES